MCWNRGRDEGYRERKTKSALASHADFLTGLVTFSRSPKNVLVGGLVSSARSETKLKNSSPAMYIRSHKGSG